MADIWKIGQDVKASEFYDKSKNGYIYTTEGEGEDAKVNASKMPMFYGGKIFAANRLALVCKEMASTYDQIIADQNEYMADIDASLNEISDLQKDLKSKIEQREKEVEDLTKKKEDGTITEEEESELESKGDDLAELRLSGSDGIDAKTDEVQDKSKKIVGKYDSKAKIATDYSETALEKGEELANTKDKRKSFWRSIFGGWNKQKERDAGNNLVDAGNNLFDQVATSRAVEDKIAKNQKKSVSK